MSESGQVSPAARHGLCEFPGVHCPNAKLPDPQVGPPTKYCGQEGPGLDGRPVVHNPKNAYTANKRLAQRAEQAAGAAGRPDVGEHSAARLTLEHQMAVLPRELEQLRSFLSDVVDAVAVFADADTAAAEVQQLQAAHRVQLAEAEQQRGEQEQRRREADQRAAEAAQAQAYAEAAADEAIAETESARAETAAAVEAADRARAAAEAAQAAAAAQIEQIRAETEQRISEIRAAADEQVQQAHAEAEAARIAQAAAESDQHMAQTAATAAETSRAAAEAELREVQDQRRVELEQQRAEARTEREQIRADYQALLADVKQAAEGRVDVLKSALRAAEQTADDLRWQRDETTDAQGSPAPRRGGEPGAAGRSSDDSAGTNEPGTSQAPSASPVPDLRP